jgi:hypothetical protein
MPATKALNVKPGKYKPGEKIIQPKKSAIAAIIAPLSGPNKAAKMATGKKPKLMRMKGVLMAKICVKIILKATNMADIIRVLV